MTSQSQSRLTPKLRFPEFRKLSGWEGKLGDELFDQISNREAPPGLPILAITQEHGAIPRDAIDYHVSVTDKSLETYKEVRPGDFIISLRSFQGGIEYSEYHGICSPAYVVLRKKTDLFDAFYKHYFKSNNFIQQLTKNLEGLRDGKMVSYKQFSELLLPWPHLAEQQKISTCLDRLDGLILANYQKLDALKAHKKALMQRLFPRKGETAPRLRFPEFQSAAEWTFTSVGELINSGYLFPPRDGNHGSLHPKSSDYVTNGIPFIMASDLGGGQIDVIGCHFISKELAESLQKGFALEGDVLLSHKGTVGEVAVVRNICTPYIMLTPQVTYYRIRNNEKLSKEFLAQFFMSPDFQSHLIKLSGGGTRAYIGITEQANLPIAIPKDISEQHRIAGCLHFLDESITAQTQISKTLKRKKTYLTQKLMCVGNDGEA